MTPQEFCYWLQGYFELRGTDAAPLTSLQVESIRNHLNLVFTHTIDSPDPTGKLQAAHDGKKLLTEDDKAEINKKIEELKASTQKSVKFLSDKGKAYRC